ncbi:hypothetical protein BS78_08G159800 [Paspalum vaginatum]|nr:hypothetical protein BS78_08G159800 [Paspalum vaginatum]
MLRHSAMAPSTSSLPSMHRRGGPAPALAGGAPARRSGVPGLVLRTATARLGGGLQRGWRHWPPARRGADLPLYVCRRRSRQSRRCGRPPAWGPATPPLSLPITAALVLPRRHWGPTLCGTRRCGCLGGVPPLRPSLPPRRRHPRPPAAMRDRPGLGGACWCGRRGGTLPPPPSSWPSSGQPGGALAAEQRWQCRCYVVVRLGARNGG